MLKMNESRFFTCHQAVANVTSSTDVAVVVAFAGTIYVSAFNAFADSDAVISVDVSTSVTNVDDSNAIGGSQLIQIIAGIKKILYIG